MDSLGCNDANPICKHIAKAPQANTTAQDLSKSLQSQRSEKLFLKNFLTL